MVGKQEQQFFLLQTSNAIVTFSRHQNSPIDFLSSAADAQLMPDGAVGHLNGALAVVTARKGENQFHISQGQERVFRKSTEARIAPSLKTRPERDMNPCTRKSRPALNFPTVLNLQP